LGGELSHAEWVRADQGSVELSNVNVAKAMVDIINQTRMFDLNMRLIQTAEQNSRQANTLISLQRN
jgi:flagellar basal-body rod protein FlgF